MVLHEYFPELANWQVRILASDLSTEMLDRARQGRYTQFEVNRGVPAALLVRYFQRHGLEWSVVEPIRRMIDFQAINLVGRLAAPGDHGPRPDPKRPDLLRRTMPKKTSAGSDRGASVARTATLSWVGRRRRCSASNRLSVLI